MSGLRPRDRVLCVQLICSQLEQKKRQQEGEPDLHNKSPCVPVNAAGPAAPGPGELRQAPEQGRAWGHPACPQPLRLVKLPETLHPQLPPNPSLGTSPAILGARAISEGLLPAGVWGLGFTGCSEGEKVGILCTLGCGACSHRTPASTRDFVARGLFPAEPRGRGAMGHQRAAGLAE